MKCSVNDDPAAATYVNREANISKSRVICDLEPPVRSALVSSRMYDSALPTIGNERGYGEAITRAGGEQWYALQVRPRFEKVVATHLQYKQYKEYLPLYRSRRKWSDRIKEIELPLFPGYIFCKFDVCQRLPILVIPGVMAVVGMGKNPVPVPEEEIAAVQAIARSGLSYEPSGFLSVGQTARIERGPLQGLVGIVLANKKNCRLIISVNLLQRSVAVEVDSDGVMPLPMNSAPTAMAEA